MAPKRAKDLKAININTLKSEENTQKDLKAINIYTLIQDMQI